MKTQVRQGVFEETDSTKIHSLTITTITIWNAFKCGSLLMKGYPHKISFIDANSIDEERVFTLNKCDNGEDYSNYEYMTYEAFEQLKDIEVLFEKLDNVLAISLYN